MLVEHQREVIIQIHHVIEGLLSQGGLQEVQEEGFECRVGDLQDVEVEHFVEFVIWELAAWFQEAVSQIRAPAIILDVQGLVSIWLLIEAWIAHY